VSKLSPGGPAHRAGVQLGDMVLGVGTVRVHGLAELFRAVWRLGAAGGDVPLTIARAGDVLHITVKSADRNDFLKKPNLHRALCGEQRAVSNRSSGLLACPELPVDIRSKIPVDQHVQHLHVPGRAVAPRVTGAPLDDYIARLELYLSFVEQQGDLSF